MYDAIFEKAFMFVLKWEGGYTNDPDDPGGETKYGISKRQYPYLDIKHLTLEQAKDIYYKDYWLKAKCDLISNHCPKAAIMHFNFAVNIGIERSAKFLQKAINRQGFSLTVDGIIGPITLQALSQCNCEWLVDTYTVVTSIFYNKLVNKYKHLTKFYKGWMNRVLDLYQELTI